MTEPRSMFEARVIGSPNLNEILVHGRGFLRELAAVTPSSNARDALEFLDRVEADGTLLDYDMATVRERGSGLLCGFVIVGSLDGMPFVCSWGESEVGVREGYDQLGYNSHWSNDRFFNRNVPDTFAPLR